MFYKILTTGYFLLQSKDCMIETCMQFAGVRVRGNPVMKEMNAKLLCF